MNGIPQSDGTRKRIGLGLIAEELDRLCFKPRISEFFRQIYYH